MLILCVYGLWEQSRLVGVGLAVLVVSLVTTAIIMRDTKPVSNLLDILVHRTLILNLHRTLLSRLVCRIYQTKVAVNLYPLSKNQNGSFHVELGNLLPVSGCTLWGQ